MNTPRPIKKHPVIAILVAALVFLISAYFLGPRPQKVRYDDSWPIVPDSPKEIETYILRAEGKLRLKPDNQSRIVWYDPQKKDRTSAVMLYLHGFSASWFEAEPLHRNLCREFGMNLLLPRLQAHGLADPNPLLNLTPHALYRSALNALALAEKLGERVIVVGTSTGGSLGLMLAARFPEKVSALILLSPNIRINARFTGLLTGPWGLQLARLMTGSPFRDSGDRDPLSRKYWYSRYRIEGIVALQQFLQTAMNSATFNRVVCPVFLGYYYRDEAHQDNRVKVGAMLDMFRQLGTPERLKSKESFPQAGVHVIGNEYLNPDYPAVYRQVRLFLAGLKW